MRHYISLFTTLACLWLMLSGEYTFSHPLVAVTGVLSCLLVTWLSWRLDIHERVWSSHSLRYTKLPAYTAWLIKEIIHANWDVTKRIVASLCGKKDAITPCLARLESTQSSNLSRVIYANSITLTPGTVSVYVEKQHIIIHALSQEGAAELGNGDMDQRVSALEIKR
jgi:multicomponent Na+:H+ antiporter subunit E